MGEPGPGTLGDAQSDQQPRVLLVEDNADMRLLYQLTMNRLGLDVVTLNDGQTALEHLDLDYDVYVFDVMLPSIDGLELTRRLRLSKPHAPVVLASALACPSEVDDGYQAGATVYLTKPCPPYELAHTIWSLANASSVA